MGGGGGKWLQRAFLPRARTPARTHARALAVCVCVNQVTFLGLPPADAVYPLPLPANHVLAAAVARVRPATSTPGDVAGAEVLAGIGPKAGGGAAGSGSGSSTPSGTDLLSADALAAALAAAGMVTTLVQPVPVCGNAVCEAGEVAVALAGGAGSEAALCPQDCELAATSCAAGAGGAACSAAGACVTDSTGAPACACFAGHAGAACEACAAGFMAAGTAANGAPLCLRLVPAAAASRGAAFPALTVGASVAGGLVVLALAAAVMAYYARRGSRPAPEVSVRSPLHVSSRVLPTALGAASASSVLPDAAAAAASPQRDGQTSLPASPAVQARPATGAARGASRVLATASYARALLRSVCARAVGTAWTGPFASVLC